MSTKVSVAYGDNFHFYQECFDEENVYLQIEGVEFKATPHGVMVQIPLHIWSVIREHSLLNLSLVDKSDDEIEAMVTSEVTQRIKEYAEALEEQKTSMIFIGGSFVYGSPDLSRQEQIENGIQSLSNEREKQRELLSKINALKEEQ